jgi:STAM-binding protein
VLALLTDSDLLPAVVCCVVRAVHAVQTCFLSSVDIHTQCGYQTMLEEAVAIVMAPTDSRKKCGIFRLTTPEGLGHVQRCSYRGFHPQCSSVHYELCGHVYMNPNAKHEVIDLRS